jgi:hypothetical protein
MDGRLLAVGAVAAVAVAAAGGAVSRTGSRSVGATNDELVTMTQQVWTRLREEIPDLDERIGILRTKSGWSGGVITSVPGTELPPGFLWRREGGRDGGAWVVLDVRAAAGRTLDALAALGVAPGKSVTVASALRAADVLLRGEGFSVDRYGRYVNPDRPNERTVLKGRTIREERKTVNGDWVNANYGEAVSLPSWVEKRLHMLSNRALRTEEGEKARDVRSKRKQTATRSRAKAADKPTLERAKDTIGKLQMKAVFDAGLMPKLLASPTLLQGDARIDAIAEPFQAGMDAEVERLRAIVAEQGRLPIVDDSDLFSVDRPPWPFRIGPSLYRWDEPPSAAAAYSLEPAARERRPGEPKAYSQARPGEDPGGGLSGPKPKARGQRPEAAKTTITIERIRDTGGHLDVRIGAAPGGGTLGWDPTGTRVVPLRRDVDEERHGDGTLLARVLPSPRSVADRGTGTGIQFRRFIPIDPPVVLVTNLLGLSRNEGDREKANLLLSLAFRLFRGWGVRFVHLGTVTDDAIDFESGSGMLRFPTGAEVREAERVLGDRVLGVEPWLPQGLVVRVINEV